MNELININQESIQNKIYTIRGMHVMFELNSDEVDFMVSLNAIPSKKHLEGSLPFVFTEQGVSMLPSVLKSTIATDISIKIIRIFVNIRKFLQSN